MEEERGNPEVVGQFAWAGCPAGRAEPIPDELNRASHRIIGAAIEVHRHLGPGLLESIYRRALAYELQQQGMTVWQEKLVTVTYKGLEIDGQRLDLLVEPGVIVELKTVGQILPIHEAQLLSYLKSTGLRLGLLINFRAMTLKKGIKRIVN